MSNVLVTGSAGTVGRAPCDELRRRSRGGERVFDLEPRRLLGFEAQQRWPEGLPFPLPDA